MKSKKTLAFTKSWFSWMFLWLSSSLWEDAAIDSKK